TRAGRSTFSCDIAYSSSPAATRDVSVPLAPSEASKGDQSDQHNYQPDDEAPEDRDHDPDDDDDASEGNPANAATTFRCGHFVSDPWGKRRLYPTRKHYSLLHQAWPSRTR